MVIRLKESFTLFTVTPPDGASGNDFFCTTNADVRDLFAIADLVALEPDKLTETNELNLQTIYLNFFWFNLQLKVLDFVIILLPLLK